MPEKKRYNLKKILINAIWVILGMGTIGLLLAAMNKKNSTRCKAVDITIKGVKNNLFIDKNDVKLMLEKMNSGTLTGKPLNTFDLCGMEAVLEKNEWIKNAKLYFDNNDILKISITEREPVARIFFADGNSFYIDTAIVKLPLSSKFSARLPAFTNFPVINGRPSKADSNLLTDIKNISTFLAQDPFWMAQVEQVDIAADRSFEMIPKIGNQVIIFGSAENYIEKFNCLLIYYKNVQCKVGWNKYSKINVAYKGQVIAVRRGAGEIKMDSLKTIQLMKQLVANAQKQANDSAANIQLVQPKDEAGIPVSQARDDKFFDDQLLEDNAPDKNPITLIPAVPAPVTAKPVQKSIDLGKENITKTHYPKNKFDSSEKPDLLPLKKTVTKPAIKKPASNVKKQPKAIMQPANDY